MILLFEFTVTPGGFASFVPTERHQVYLTEPISNN